MEEIILKLLVTDTEIIQQATAQLREAFKNTESTQALYQLIISSSYPQVRQYSALLLRKRYSKGKHWLLLPEQVKVEFKAVLLQALVHESEKPVKSVIAQLAGVIVKHELPQNGWPEIMQFIHHLLSSDNLQNQELGMYTLSIMTEIAPDAYLRHVQKIMELLNEALNNYSNSVNSISCYVLDTMLHLVCLVEGNQIMVNAYHQMMPNVIQTIISLTSLNEEKAVKGFELLDELCERAATVISPHIKMLVEMCIFIANNNSLSDDVKIKAVVFIGWLAKTKKKSIVKHKLVEPVIDMLFLQMCRKPDDENQEIYFTGEDDNTPITSATQTLDLMALHLPPDKLIPYLLKHIEPGLEGTDIYAKKASYLSMAVLAEGCSEYIRNKYLESFLRCICKGITDSAVVVRNAALFALGQFSEHLQPEISRFSDELLPILFQNLGHICSQIRQERKDLPSADRMFYALEIFAENLNEGLLPYLPTLMTILFEILTDNNSPVHICELALSAIGAAANASKENMLPYFEKTINILERYLILEQNVSEESTCLRIQAVDTLGVLARTIGETNFAPLAMKSLEMGMNLLKSTDDPDLKKSVYGLLASTSMVLKSEMTVVLPVIIDYMIASVKSSEGIVTCFKDDENSEYLVYEDFSNSENDEEDIENTDNEDEENDHDDDIAGYSVENAYVEEKEEAILALREIAEHTKEAFLPYLETSFQEVFKLANYPQEDIRKAAVDALMQFCINFSKIETQEGKHATQKVLSVLIPKLSELIRLDEERSVVMQALDAYSELVEQLKSDILISAGHKEAIINCIVDIMLGHTQCQDQDELDGEGDVDQSEAEHDELLFECAGQVLINLGKAVSPQEFRLDLQKIFPILIKRLKNNNSEAQRSFSIGTILECFPSLKDEVTIFALELLPIFIKLTNDTCDEIRSNAIFGLGELAFYGRETIYPHYLEILQVLSNAISKESHAGVRDNIIGALARLIITNYSIIPLEQVFPVFVSHLPLREDLEENKTAFKCILELYNNGHSILRPQINALLKASVNILHNENIDEETKNIVIQFIKLCQRDFLDDWNTFCSQLSSESSVELQRIFIHYLEILQVLSNAISKESHAGVRDNIIGALARLIITNYSIIPLEQVFPVFVSHLPLREDLEENKTAFKCILELYNNGHSILRPQINALLKASVNILHNENIDEETKNIVIQFIKLCQRDFLDDWNTFCSQLSSESSVELQRIFIHYLEILQVLSNAISKESHAGVRDNIIGALARLIITNYSIIPLEQVFPVFVSHLPLREDLEENKTAFKCILELYNNGHSILRPQINALLKASVNILHNENIDEETKNIVIQFIKLCQRDFLDDWNTFCSQLSSESSVELQRIFM